MTSLIFRNIIFCTLLCTIPGFSQEKYKDLVEKLKPGISNGEAKKIIRPYSQKYDWNWRGSSDKKNPYETHQLDDETFVRFYLSPVKDEWGGLSNTAQLLSIQFFRFDDLKSEIPEQMLESIRLIYKSPSPKMTEGFNPIRLIQAVNHLQVLGKAEALNRLKLYYDLATKDPKRASDYDLDEDRIFLIVRLLFVREDGDAEMPIMHIGNTQPIIPESNKDWPLFPLVLRDEIPFFMANGYMLAGRKESPLDHLEFAKKKCKLRADILKPSTHPIITSEELLYSSEWEKLFASPDSETNSRRPDSRQRYNIRLQALKCLPSEPIVNETLDIRNRQRFNPNNGGDAKADKFWLEVKSKLLLKSVQWNSNLQAFEAKESK